MAFISSVGAGRAPVEQRSAFNFSTLGSGSIAGWYDFNDISTLFQDVAAATPVVSPGNPILRINDKSGFARNLTVPSSLNAPIYDYFDGSKMAARFPISGDRYLSAATPAAMDYIYRGAAFTMAFHYKIVTVGSTETFFDTTNYNFSNDGVTCIYDGLGGDTFAMYLSNSTFHSTADDDKKGSNTNEANPEYMTIYTSQALRGNADGVILFGNDIVNGYSQQIYGASTSTVAMGSPASGSSPYALRLGATATSSINGLKGYIRRWIIYSSYLNSTDRTTLMTEIRK